MAKREQRTNPVSIFLRGDGITKLSFLIWGLGNIVRGQLIKGIIYLLLEISYIWFMISSGLHNMAMLGSLGTSTQGMTFN